jgi:hypothetical protein
MEGEEMKFSLVDQDWNATALPSGWLLTYEYSSDKGITYNQFATSKSEIAYDSGNFYFVLPVDGKDKTYSRLAVYSDKGEQMIETGVFVENQTTTEPEQTPDPEPEDEQPTLSIDLSETEVRPGATTYLMMVGENGVYDDQNGDYYFAAYQNGVDLAISMPQITMGTYQFDVPMDVVGSLQIKLITSTGETLDSETLNVIREADPQFDDEPEPETEETPEAPEVDDVVVIPETVRLLRNTLPQGEDFKFTLLDKFDNKVDYLPENAYVTAKKVDQVGGATIVEGPLTAGAQDVFTVRLPADLEVGDYDVELYTPTKRSTTEFTLVPEVVEGQELEIVDIELEKFEYLLGDVIEPVLYNAAGSKVNKPDNWTYELVHKNNEEISSKFKKLLINSFTTPDQLGPYFINLRDEDGNFIVDEVFNVLPLPAQQPKLEKFTVEELGLTEEEKERIEIVKRDYVNRAINAQIGNKTFVPDEDLEIERDEDGYMCSDTERDQWSRAIVESAARNKWIFVEVERRQINGQEKGIVKCRPADYATRAEIAAIIVRYLGLTEESEEGFEDVPEDHPLSRHIKIAKKYGIFQGDPNGFFRPEAPVNRAELLTIIARMFFDQGLSEEVMDAMKDQLPVDLKFEVDAEWAHRPLAINYHFGVARGRQIEGPNGEVIFDAALAQFVQNDEVVKLLMNAQVAAEAANRRRAGQNITKEDAARILAAAQYQRSPEEDAVEVDGDIVEDVVDRSREAFDIFGLNERADVREFGFDPQRAQERLNYQEFPEYVSLTRAFFEVNEPITPTVGVQVGNNGREIELPETWSLVYQAYDPDTFAPVGEPVEFRGTFSLDREFYGGINLLDSEGDVVDGQALRVTSPYPSEEFEPATINAQEVLVEFAGQDDPSRFMMPEVRDSEGRIVEHLGYGWNVTYAYITAQGGETEEVVMYEGGVNSQSRIIDSSQSIGINDGLTRGKLRLYEGDTLVDEDNFIFGAEAIEEFELNQQAVNRVIALLEAREPREIEVITTRIASGNDLRFRVLDGEGNPVNAIEGDFRMTFGHEWQNVSLSDLETGADDIFTIENFDMGPGGPPYPIILERRDGENWVEIDRDAVEIIYYAERFVPPVEAPADLEMTSDTYVEGEAITFTLRDGNGDQIIETDQPWSISVLDPRTNGMSMRESRHLGNGVYEMVPHRHLPMGIGEHELRLVYVRERQYGHTLHYPVDSEEIEITDAPEPLPEEPEEPEVADLVADFRYEPNNAGVAVEKIGEKVRIEMPVSFDNISEGNVVLNEWVIKGQEAKPSNAMMRKSALQTLFDFNATLMAMSDLNAPNRFGVELTVTDDQGNSDVETQYFMIVRDRDDKFSLQRIDQLDQGVPFADLLQGL